MMYKAELCHHGILGQRWGVRRYQNADGSLTTAGLQRYGGRTSYGAARKVANDVREAQDMYKKEYKSKIDILKANKRLGKISKDEFKEQKNKAKQDLTNKNNKEIEAASKAIAQVTSRGRNIATGALATIGSIGLTAAAAHYANKGNMLATGLLAAGSGALYGVGITNLNNEALASNYRKK